MFLTAIAGVSISLPIALRIAETNGLKKQDSFGKACLLGITYGGLTGGIATPLGTPINLVMMQYLKELGKFDLTFLHWVSIGFPVSLLIFGAGYFILVAMLRLDNNKIEKPAAELQPFTPKEKRNTSAFLIIMMLFLFSQFLEQSIPWISLNLNIISVICSLMIVLPPFQTVEWKDALKNLDWESLIFLVGSIALGYLLYNTHTADLIAGGFFQLTGNLNLYLYVFVFCAFTIVMHVMLSSNTVTGTVIIPLLISFAQHMGVSPWYVSAPAIYCISLAFILPTESPTNIITYNTGYYELKDMLRIGTVLTIASMVIISLFLIGFGMLTGLYTVG
jgi:sodium-dependent dicarboxylate transporter 2/3/5